MNAQSWVIGFILTCCALVGVARATMIMAFSVEELTQRAEKVFVGACVKTERQVTDQGLSVVDVTFTVREALKGVIGETVTFRQVALAPSGANNSRFSALWPAASMNTPNYAPGEEILLFLAKEGASGLTAPIGLSQGAMPITTTPSGAKLITNQALKNTKRTDLSLPVPGEAAPYTQFVAALRTMIQSGQ